MAPKYAQFALVALVLAAVHAEAQIRIDPVGFLPGYETASVCTGVSADGNWVCGSSTYERSVLQQAYRWSRTAGMQGLGFLEPGRPVTAAQAISGDGNTISLQAQLSTGGPIAGYWTLATGCQFIGGTSAIEAYCVSFDGQIGIGNTNVGWSFDKTLGLTWLGPFLPYGISADGGFIVGTAVQNNLAVACKWLRTSGFNTLETIPGTLQSWAVDVTANGYKIVGACRTAEGELPVVWAEGVPSVLNVPNGWRNVLPEAISGDGRVIVGSADHNNVAVIFVWTEKTGIFDLHQYLISHGAVGAVDWQRLYYVNDLSYDGTTIVGSGYKLDHMEDLEGYVVTLPKQTFAPANTILAPGMVISGSPSNLGASDNAYYVLRPGVVFSSTQSPIVLTAEFTLPSPFAAGLTLVYESRAQVPGERQTIEAYNFADGYWVQLSQSLLGNDPPDTALSLFLTPPESFIDPDSHKVRIRASYRLTVPVFAYPWLVYLDQVCLQYTPGW